MDWMFHTRTIHTSYMTATLPTPDFIIFYIFTRNKNRKKAKKVSDSAFWFLLLFCLFSAGWNLSTAAQTAGPHASVPLPQANVHGAVSSKGDHLESDKPDFWGPWNTAGSRATGEPSWFQDSSCNSSPRTRRETRKNKEVSNLRDMKRDTSSWSHTCRLLLVLSGLPALEMERASSCSLDLYLCLAPQNSMTVAALDR